MGSFICDKLLIIFLLAFQRNLVRSGSMRNYTGMFHPAGGADPRYLNYGAGVDVPNLVNPRIPRPGIPQTPQHHADRFIGVMPGIMETFPSYEDDDYYDEDDEESDDIIPVEDFTGNQYGHDREMSTRRNRVHIQTIMLRNDENDESENEVDDGLGNEDSDYEQADDEDSFPAESYIHCRDGRHGYRTGEIFRLTSDPCIQCRCSPLGPQCNVTKCDPLPVSCIELKRDVDQCCPSCVKQGCILGRVTLAIGESLQTTACETCKCGEDGQTYCSVADCTPPPCVDSSIPQGQCCPICPHGPNCYTKNREEIIPANIEWIPTKGDSCTICRCRRDPAGSQLWMGHGQAECIPQPRCRHSRIHVRPSHHHPRAP